MQYIIGVPWRSTAPLIVTCAPAVHRHAPVVCVYDGCFHFVIIVLYPTAPSARSVIAVATRRMLTVINSMLGRLPITDAGKVSNYGPGFGRAFILDERALWLVT